MFCHGSFFKNSQIQVTSIYSKVYIKIFLNELNYLVFLSEGEFNFAKKKLPKYKNKYSFIPFAVDLTFGKQFCSRTRKKYILFVGNDGNRITDLQKIF